MSMWCQTDGADLKGKLQDYVTYFEGTCEFCVAHLGIKQYLNEIEEHLAHSQEYDDETLMLLYFDEGVMLFKTEDMDGAKAAWEKALKYAKAVGDEVFMAKATSYLAIYYYWAKDRTLCQQYFDEATEIFAKKKLYTELALHYVNILWYKRYDDNKAQVLEYLDKAFEYVQKSDSARNGRVYLHLGYIYTTIFDDFVKGMGYLLTARDICHSLNNVEMESMTMNVLASGYMQLYHYEKAIDIYHTLGDERYRNITAELKCMILNNLTNCYLKIGDTEGALHAIDSMREHIDDAHATISSQFEAVHEWLLAGHAIASGNGLTDVPALLAEANEIYERYADNFPVDHFDICLGITRASYEAAIGHDDRALKLFDALVERAHAHGRYCECEIYNTLADYHDAHDNPNKALYYRQLSDSAFTSEEKEELLAKYDEVAEEFKKHFAEEATGVHEIEGMFSQKELDEYAGRSSLFPFGRTGCIQVDIDFFMEFNARYGRNEGDKCIRRVADIIKEVTKDVRAKTCYAKGDAFTIVAKSTDESKLVALAEQVVANVRTAQMHHNGSPVSPYVTVSAGCYLASPKEDIKIVYGKAADAMHQAKMNGHNQVYLQK